MNFTKRIFQKRRRRQEFSRRIRLRPEAYTKCAVAEFDLNDSNLVTQIWVDCKKGTLLRTINKGLGDNGEEYEIVENYAATYDIVTDKDVEMPDITGYNLI